MTSKKPEETSGRSFNGGADAVSSPGLPFALEEWCFCVPRDAARAAKVLAMLFEHARFRARVSNGAGGTWDIGSKKT